MEKLIEVTLGYYGNPDYGKRVFWIGKTSEYVWGMEFIPWVNEMKKEGYKIVITNSDEVVQEFIDAVK